MKVNQATTATRKLDDPQLLLPLLKSRYFPTSIRRHLINTRQLCRLHDHSSRVQLTRCAKARPAMNSIMKKKKTVPGCDSSLSEIGLLNSPAGRGQEKKGKPSVVAIFQLISLRCHQLSSEYRVQIIKPFKGAIY